VAQQYYFSVGEIFSFYHLRWRQVLDAGVDLRAHDRFYFTWDHTPLVNLLDGLQGPFLLRQLHLSNQALFHIGCVVIPRGRAVVVPAGADTTQPNAGPSLRWHGTDGVGAVVLCVSVPPAPSDS
jgi:hypothetical protein